MYLRMYALALAGAVLYSSAIIAGVFLGMAITAVQARTDSEAKASERQ